VIFGFSSSIFTIAAKDGCKVERQLATSDAIPACAQHGPMLSQYAAAYCAAKSLEGTLEAPVSSLLLQPKKAMTASEAAHKIDRRRTKKGVEWSRIASLLLIVHFILATPSCEQQHPENTLPDPISKLTAGHC